MTPEKIPRSGLVRQVDIKLYCPNPQWHLEAREVILTCNLFQYNSAVFAGSVIRIDGVEVPVPLSMNYKPGLNAAIHDALQLLFPESHVRPVTASVILSTVIDNINEL